MDVWQRRELIKMAPNPERAIDAVSTLAGLRSIAGFGRVTVTLRYVPDALIADGASFAMYLNAIAAGTWTSLEHLATSILQDANNTLVPRWVRVAVQAGDKPGDATVVHRVEVEDRQPRWDNPSLLAHLRPV